MHNQSQAYQQQQSAQSQQAMQQTMRQLKQRRLPNDQQTQQQAQQPQQEHQQQPGQDSAINKAYTLIALALVFLLPLLVVPLTNNFIIHTKLMLIFTGIFITGGFFLYSSFKNKGWRFVLSPLTLPLVLFGLAALGSTLLTQNFPVKNLFGMGAAYLGLALIPLLGADLGEQKLAKWLVPTISISAALLSIASLLQMLGYGPTHLINSVTNFDLEHSLIFNLAGTSLIAAQFIFIALVGTTAQIIKNKHIQTLHTITLPILLLGLGLHIWSLLPGQAAQMLLTPLGASWSVALDSLRAPRTALIGHGPEAYNNVFTRFRPTWLNGTEFWQVGFNTGFGLPLTIIVQLGIIGLAAWLLLLIKFFKNKVQQNPAVNFKNSPITWMLGAAFVLQIFLTPSIALLGLQAFLLLFWIIEFKDEFSVIKLKALSATVDGKLKNQASHTQANYWITLGTTGLLTAGLFYLIYFSGRVWASHHQAFLANQGFIENNAVKVYEHQRQAVVLSPHLDQHRRAYALTNLDIAIALSNQIGVSETEFSEAELELQQEQINQLVLQAIREGQAAATIDPTDSRNWAVLAQLYQGLIGSSEEAEQWAVNAYVEAVSGDPTNPLLRLQLGHIFFGAEQIQQALNVYEQAINLKPDLPAGYFHLGAALRAVNQLEQAQQAWQQALNLLEPGSEDYLVVQESLAQLRQEIEDIEAAGLTEEVPAPGFAEQQIEPALDQDDQDIDAFQDTPLSREIDLTQENLQDRSARTAPPTTDLDLEDAPRITEEEVLDEDDPDAQPQEGLNDEDEGGEGEGGELEEDE